MWEKDGSVRSEAETSTPNHIKHKKQQKNTNPEKAT